MTGQPTARLFAGFFWLADAESLTEIRLFAAAVFHGNTVPKCSDTTGVARFLPINIDELTLPNGFCLMKRDCSRFFQRIVLIALSARVFSRVGSNLALRTVLELTFDGKKKKKKKEVKKTKMLLHAR